MSEMNCVVHVMNNGLLSTYLIVMQLFIEVNQIDTNVYNSTLKN